MSQEPAPKKRRLSKQVQQGKRLCLTWHLPPGGSDPQPLLDMLKDCCHRKDCEWICQLEKCPKTGQLHLQGYIEATQRLRWTELKLPKEIHWEFAKGNRLKNIEYCSKEESRVSGPYFSLGLKPPRKVVLCPMTYHFQKVILSTIKVDPDRRTIHWYWSHHGGAGKTETVRYLISKMGACLLSGKGADVRNGLLTWVKEKGMTPEIVCVDVPRSHIEFLSYEALENIKNMLFYSGKYEGGMVNGPHCHLFVFANEPPKAGMLSEDRLVEYFIGKTDADDEVKTPEGLII